jgi:fumarate hydratase, class II
MLQTLSRFLLAFCRQRAKVWFALDYDVALRWMNRGPLSGLGEISLKPLQPGTSIMPGKVNPVIPEAVADNCIADFVVNSVNIEANLARNPVLVTALNREIGYSRAAEIAKRTYREGRPTMEVAVEMTDLPKEILAAPLDPKNLI